MTPAERARLRRVDVFAERLVGEPLWPHQREVAESGARFRCICAGRQVGKSRTLSVIALHAAYCTAGLRVLVISAGEDASRDLLGQITALAQSPWLGGSIAADDLSKLVLSNGSVIRCVPASQKQIRGKSVDLLIVDEGAFVSEEIWSASRYTILARPGSRVLLSSTPYGRRSGWFATLWRAGMAGEPGHESWHWPSTVSPLVDRELVEAWRRTDPPRVFAREVEAQWLDDAGAWFTADEVEAMAADYDLVSPEAWSRRAWVVAGVDWGFSPDASALVVVAGDQLAEDGSPRWWVPWLELEHRTPYAQWVERVVDVSRQYPFAQVVSERNGVGAMPSQVLARRLVEVHGRDPVVPHQTTWATKEDSFGALRLWAQQGRFRIPRHPELLKQLSNLEFEVLDSGATRIAVPERSGHDDLVMALSLAVGEVMAVDAPEVSDEVVGMDDLWGDDDEEAYLDETRFSVY